MAATDLFTNLATTTVNSGGTTAPIAGTVETWVVSSSTTWPSVINGLTQFRVVEDDVTRQSEVMTVINQGLGSLTAGLTLGATVTSLAVTALSSAVASGDQLRIGSGVTTQLMFAAAAAAVNATSISVTSVVANASYGIGALIADVTTPGTSRTTWAVTRGSEGTTPVTHPGGFLIVQTITAGLLAEIESGITATALPPANPVVDQLWLSSAFGDVSVPPGIADRKPIITATLAWEGATVQEANVWQDATGKFNLIYSAGFGAAPQEAIGYAQCAAGSDPMVAANWVKNAAPIIGSGNGGVAGTAQQPSVFIEGNMIYVYFYTGVADLKVSSGTSPTALALNGTSALVATAAATNIHNVGVIKDGTTYRMIFEASTVSQKFQMGTASATSPLGPFTVGIFPLTSVRHSSTAAPSTPGGATLFKEGNTFVMWYHDPPTSLVPYYIWRATTTDLTTDAWVTEPYPLIRLVETGALDQVADVFPWRIQGSSVGVVFWSAVDNLAPTSVIMGAILQPRLRQWDGSFWRNVGPQSDTTPEFALRRSNLQASGSFTTTTVGAIVPVTGTQLTYVPTRNEICLVTMRANVKTSVATVIGCYITVTGTTYDGQQNAGVNQEDMPANLSRGFTTCVTFTLRKGVTYTFQIGVYNGAGAATTTVNLTPGLTQIETVSLGALNAS